MEFSHLAIWIRIYDLSTAFIKKGNGRQLGCWVGQVIHVEVDGGGSGWRQFIRVRVKLDVSKPLIGVLNAVTKKGSGCEAFRVKYEKIPCFCEVCGLLGRINTECGDGVHEDKEFQYSE